MSSSSNIPTPEVLTAQLSQWISDITEKPAPSLTPETDLAQDLGLDSLALAELSAKVRVHYKIKLRAGELRNSLAVGPLVALVRTRLSEPPAA
jgi:acyl carrier protein